MNKLIAAVMVAGAAVVAAPALAADIPYYPPIDIPDVDYGVQGSFYLRGSAAGNGFWPKEVDSFCDCTTQISTDATDGGYGYSFGAGAGYETGTGLRFDATIDRINNEGAATEYAAPFNVPGKYSLKLRSTIALANVYYDFSFGNGGDYGYSAAGGAFGYVGAGAGVAFNTSEIDAPAGYSVPSGDNTSFAAAGMVGVGYDFGAFTADLGYRAIYINEVTNQAAAPDYFSTKNNWIHEVRTTLRYRFN